MAQLNFLCLLGLTGTGKTSLALDLARKYPIAIINFDSRQVYQDFPIVTAQPSIEEQQVCPHYLFGFLKVYEQINAGQFVCLAEEKIKQVSEQKRLPVLVGGTGLYLRALLLGLAPIPPISEEIRQKVTQWEQEKGLAFLYEYLSKVDLEYASKIHFNDKQRIKRALEVYFQTGKPFSTWHKKQEQNVTKYNCLKIGLKMDLSLLTDFLAQRIDKMIQTGAIEEVKQAWLKYGDKSLPGFSGIGIPEIIEYLEGKVNFIEMKLKWLKNTRAYAKRQLTWFKKESNVIWNTPANVRELKKEIEKWLKQLNYF
ncbi:MAG: tRNA (adenosine(37)-N6)-dimethylallyltransferase MiaA [Desulfonauticus sp.]|nr:tRNA (adenosine(37)-N6)-dimethylallyltransferase MiaA [Desulfonauticus sp.]